MTTDSNFEPVFKNQLGLTAGMQFELERSIRDIDSCGDIEELKSLAKQLVGAYLHQKAATAWIITETMSRPPSVEGLSKKKEG